MFLQDGSCEIQVDMYQIGNHQIKIQCFDQSNRKQLSCESRVVWLASVALANWLDSNADYLQGSILELGTGTGLLGVFIGLKAPSCQLVMTDLERQSLETAEANLELNQVKNAKTLFYKWGANPINSGERFDLVVGSDIIYSREVATTTVAQSLNALLSKTGTAILANDMIRYGQLEDAFEERLKCEGLAIVEKQLLPDANGTTSHRLVVIKRLLNFE